MFETIAFPRLAARAGLAATVIGLAACKADAPKSLSRDAINSGEVPPAEEIRVAEYLSYYEQRFPEPVGETVGLDLRVGNPLLPEEGGEAWLQIGVQAASARGEDLAPLNLVLVIDVSGSMDAPEKMPYVQEGLRYFLHSLAQNDDVAVVGYDDEAVVLSSSRPVGDGRWVDEVIGRLRPGSGTNLHAGLMERFRLAKAGFDRRRNNRVILLTDGIANVGQVDPASIAADALSYNEQGIHLSTIGLGHDINDALLSELAHQGRGAYHFIDSAEEIEKVFRREVSGLVEKAAGQVSVILAPAPGVRVEQITGLDGPPPPGPVELPLPDLGTGDSQVLLARLSVEPGHRGARPLADVELRYRDAFADRDASASAVAMVEAGLSGRYDPLRDTEVLRNATIQRSAEGLKEVDRLYRDGRYRDALSVARQMEQALRDVADLTGDEQVAKDAAMMRQLQDNLAPWAEQGSYDGGSASRDDAGWGSGRRVLPTGPVPRLDIR